MLSNLPVPVIRHWTQAALRRRQRAVLTLKIALPVIAVGLLGLLAAWPSLTELPMAPLPDDVAQAQMVKARYVGADSQNRPFIVDADQAVQRADNPDVMDMTIIHAEMDLEQGHWMAIKAQTGHYDKIQQTIALRGKVNIFHDGGYEFRSDEAFVDAKAGEAWGNQPVEGQGPFGALTGQGFRLHNKGQTVILTGPAHLTLAGSQGENR